MRHKINPLPSSAKQKKLELLYQFFSRHYNDMPLLLADLATFFTRHNTVLAKDIIAQAKIHFPHRPRVLDLYQQINEQFNEHNSSLEQQLLLVRDTYLRLHTSGLSIQEIDNILSRGGHSSRSEDKFSTLDWKTLNKYLDSFASAESCNTSRTGKAERFPQNSELLLTQIQASIEKRKGFSFIRLGDGEGTLLNTDSKDSRTNDLTQILTTWWGTSNIEAQQLRTIHSHLLDAFNSADIVGIPDLHHQLADFRIEDNRFARAYSKLNKLASENTDKTYVSAYANHSLVKNNDLTRIISHRDLGISVISGHPQHLVSEYFIKNYGKSLESYISIPCEHKFQEQFGYSNQEQHFPILYEEICKNLSKKNLTGKLFLVGAGVLGKYYCHLIKQQGGVALDLGSVFDYLLGHNTRKFFNTKEYKNHKDQ